MKVIVPNELSLLSCSIAESDTVDAPLWDAGKTYSQGQKVRYNHVIYESLLDGNKNNAPDTQWSGVEAKWKKMEATLPWKMLDDYVETQTRAPLEQNLSFCVPFNRADSFAFLNLEGSTARVRVYDDDEPDGEEVIYDQETNLIADIWHLSLYEYNYLPITSIKHLTVTDLPQVFSGRLCVDIDPGTGATAAIGHVVAGKAYKLGYTQYGAELGFTDYSRKITDEFGVTTLVRRSFASRESLPVYLHPDQMDYVAGILQEVRGRPCVWIGDNGDYGHKSLTVYGWLEDFRMVCEGPNENQLSLEIQGLI